MSDGDMYFKKIVEYPVHGQRLSFHVSQELFSSDDVDVGTKRLLRSILGPDYGHCKKVLDLGCGYGPLGITLHKVGSERVVHMVDRDALALQYARDNSLLNQVSNAQVYGSLGYSDVAETDFDLIVSNIPAKAGEPVITNFLLGSSAYLQEDGLAAIVIVTPLEDLVSRVLAHPDVEILYRKPWPGHTVFHFRFRSDSERALPSTKALDLDIYGRTQTQFIVGGTTYDMQTVYGIPEFDSRHYRTDLLLDVLTSWNLGQVKNFAVYNSGQGYVPVVASRVLSPDRTVLVGRDLLALRITELNLRKSLGRNCAIESRHQAGVALGINQEVDLFVLILKEDEGQKLHSGLLAQSVTQLSSHGMILVASNITSIRRLENAIRASKTLRVVDRIATRGFEVLGLRVAN
jgi:16S rRNA G1207 methylase RsmC